jgi:hypothetical protein
MNQKIDVESNNLEIDCLGKRVNIIFPEASAALVCQAEVHQAREQFVVQKMQDGLKKGYIAVNDDPAVIQDLANFAGNIFDNASVLFQPDTPRDSYETRILDFKKLLP